MVALPSNMLPLGSPLPPFRLKNVVDGREVDASASTTGKAGLLVMFICNHCPYVVHIRQRLVEVAHAALDQNVAVVAINANSIETHPQDGPTAMAKLAKDEHWRFPFLFDETQDVAKAFRAACTPDLFLFDREGRLAYRGQFDDSRPSNGKPVTGADLRAALEAVAKGEAPNPNQRPSIGCNIKWRPGHEPA